MLCREVILVKVNVSFLPGNEANENYTHKIRIENTSLWAYF